MAPRSHGSDEEYRAMTTPTASQLVNGVSILTFIDQTTGVAVLTGDLHSGVRGVIRTHAWIRRARCVGR
jgi:hypothetical protein